MNKDDNKYQAISCDLHSQYELAIMHKNKIQLVCQSEDDMSIVTPIDLETRDKAEYLIAVTSDNKKLRIRLDHIIEMRILDET